MRVRDERKLSPVPDREKGSAACAGNRHHAVPVRIVHPERGMMRKAKCERCESLPAIVGGPGRLYLWPPPGHATGKVLQYLRSSERPFTRNDDGTLVVTVPTERLSDLLLPLNGVLSRLEADDTRCVYKEGEAELSVADLPQVRTFTQFLMLAQSAWLVEMLRDSRFVSHFQPIFHAGDPTRVFAHEALLRGVQANGTLVPPGHLFDVARGSGLLFQLDLAARRTAIECATAAKLATPLFLNFSPTAIYDPAHCLLSTVSAIDDAGIPHDSVVFEVVESDRTVDVYHLKGILNFYRTAGFRVALDDVGAGYSSLNLIHHLRPDFIKLDMELIRGVDRDPYKAMILQKTLEITSTLGIATIAEGVQTAEELAWVRSHGATYVQGFLLGVPAPATPAPAVMTTAG